MTGAEAAPRLVEPEQRMFGGVANEVVAQAPAAGIRAGPALSVATFTSLRRRAVLDGYKWDPQVGDADVLAPFPLVMRQSVWEWLAVQAEKLAAEANTAEAEAAGRPELLRQLGLPRALRRELSAGAPVTPSACRVLRFDFHLTAEGWRISEANSDVPGGYCEASYFTALMAEHFPHLHPAGDPAGALAQGLAQAARAGRGASEFLTGARTFLSAASSSDGLADRNFRAPSGGVIALLSAPGLMEDHQVVAYLAARLREHGLQAHLAKPEQITWRDGLAQLEGVWHRGPVSALVRFYQIEWLVRLGRSCEWGRFIRGGQTLVTNPGLAAISESKRFPLIWDQLSTPLPTWRALLPESRHPRQAPWEHDEGWLLKTAMCNTGETVSIRELLTAREWRRIRRAARWFPGGWVAQRRFQSVPVMTPLGPRHVCVGVYTVNGRAAGVYARLAVKPLIDCAAPDAALLLEDDD